MLMCNMTTQIFWRTHLLLLVNIRQGNYLAVFVGPKHLTERAGGHLAREAINIKLFIFMLCTAEQCRRLRWRPWAWDTLIYNKLKISKTLTVLTQRLVYHSSWIFPYHLTFQTPVCKHQQCSPRVNCAAVHKLHDGPRQPHGGRKGSKNVLRFLPGRETAAHLT